MLIHDSHIDRTTSGTGLVCDYTLGELQDFVAGKEFGSARADLPAPFQAAPHIRIPSLHEAFEAFPRARFNFEIKTRSPGLVASVVSLVREFAREDRTLLTAGEDEIQHILREELGRTGARPALGASLGDIVEVVRAAQANERPETDSMVLQIPRTFADRPLVTPKLLDHCHDHQILVHVWTINDPEEIQILLELGVDGIVTDHPGRMARLLADAP